MNDKLLLTPKEAGLLLSLSRRTIYELLAAGALRSVRIGRARRIPLHVLEEYVTALTVSRNIPTVPRHGLPDGRTGCKAPEAQPGTRPPLDRRRANQSGTNRPDVAGQAERAREVRTAASEVVNETKTWQREAK